MIVPKKIIWVLKLGLGYFEGISHYIIYEISNIQSIKY
jgi:hypothetical protein